MAKKLCDIISDEDIAKTASSIFVFDHLDFIRNCDVTAIEIKKEENTAYIFMSSQKYADFSLLRFLEDILKEKTGLSRVDIKIKFKDLDFIGYFGHIIEQVGHDHPHLLPVLREAVPERSKNELRIRLNNNGSDILKIRRIDEHISDIISEKFDECVKVSFISGNGAENPASEGILKKAEEAVKARPTKKVKNKTEQVLLGKSIKSIPGGIEEQKNSDETIVIQGEVFGFDKRTLNSGKSLFSFALTDKESSLYAKAIFDETKCRGMRDFYGNGQYIKVRGRIQYDSYMKERVLMARDICQAVRPMRQDTPSEKRIELHAHTQMSAMDGICDTEKLIEQAAQWGHKAIAITDHGGLFAYPDAYLASGKHDIKIIYGLEGYLVNDQDSIVENSDGRTLDSQYTVVDIETTGLSMKYDRITEIGAVRFKDGRMIDTFSSFVDPQMPIPARVSEITGINDVMVAGAKTIDDVLPELFEFVGKDCIVAHNASFDVSIIKREAKRLGKDINNPVLDTLALSKVLLPDLKRNKLGTVARRLKIKPENQHRALGDAMTTALVLRRFFEMIHFKNKEVETLEDLNTLADTESFYKNAKVYHMILLAKNKTGLKNLYKLVSKSQLEYFYKNPRIPKKVLTEHREGLIVGSACESGELYQAILENRSEQELMEIALFYDYLEIQPVGNNAFLMRDGLIKDEKQLREINKKIIALGKKAGIKTAATCDVHFIDPEDEIFREILNTAEGYSDARYQAPLYMRTTDEMLEEFSYLGEETAREVVITNPAHINEQIEVIAPIPKGTFPPRIENSDNDIKEMTYEMANRLYGEKLHPIIEERIKKELDSITKHGFSVMYMIAHKLVKKSLGDGFLVGSRGSVGSSFVAFLSGITEVNSLSPHYVCPSCFYTEFVENDETECGFDLPDKLCPSCGQRLKKDGYDIPFETFLGFDGDKEPDIDLNFSGHYQARAHKYTEELFGKDHVFRAGTVNKLASQTAYGYVKKYMEIKGIDLSKSEVDRLTEGCMGVRKTTGQHPGGIMIIPQDMEIYDFTAIGHPADDMDSETITTHFDYRFLHSSILKLDILGHDDPTMINMLEKYSGKKAADITIGDKTVMEIFRSASPLGVDPAEIGMDIGTLGIPEFGTAFVRGMLHETKPETYAELIKISGLSHGTDVWLGNAQKLIKEKTTTLKKAICCRDDIMIYLLHKGVKPAAAFTIMEDVRKGKGLKDEMIREMKECRIPDWYIWSCQQIKYMFPKAHAAAYVSMAFRIAWYKLNEPLTYYSAYFSIRCDEFDAKMMLHGKAAAKEYLQSYRAMDKLTQREKNIITILELVIEMYARGLEFLPIDLYLSDAFDFIPENARIRPPLRSIAGLGENVATNIVRERELEKFISVEDISSRARASKAIIDALAEEGCLKGLPESNQLSLL